MLFSVFLCKLIAPLTHWLFSGTYVTLSRSLTRVYAIWRIMRIIRQDFTFWMKTIRWGKNAQFPHRNALGCCWHTYNVPTSKTVCNFWTTLSSFTCFTCMHARIFLYCTQSHHRFQIGDLCHFNFGFSWTRPKHWSWSTNWANEMQCTHVMLLRSISLKKAWKFHCVILFFSPSKSLHIPNLCHTPNTSITFIMIAFARHFVFLIQSCWWVGNTKQHHIARGTHFGVSFHLKAFAICYVSLEYTICSLLASLAPIFIIPKFFGHFKMILRLFVYLFILICPCIQLNIERCALRLAPLVTHVFQTHIGNSAICLLYFISSTMCNVYALFVDLIVIVVVVVAYAAAIAMWPLCVCCVPLVFKAISWSFQSQF